MRYSHNKTKKEKGQAIVEYVMLLAILIGVIPIIANMNAALKTKIVSIVTDFREEDQSVPLIIDKDDPKGGVRLSPPVAEFLVTNPNYKGRAVHFIDKSFDTDGVVEHYYWTITGNGINDKKEYDKFNEPVKGGMEYTFRYKGTYTVSLIVVDNDGLVSNRATHTVEILDRSPTLDMTVTSHTGETKNKSQSVDVWQGCSATFRTTYDDPDLPYDVLTLFSEFTDFAGTKQTFTTVPNEFDRKFYNLGSHRYYVKVTDEDGMSVDGYVAVNVVTNPNGYSGDTSNCGSQPVTTPQTPVFKVQVSGHVKYDAATNTYYFNQGTSSTIKGVVVDWKGLTPNTYPIYWSLTDFPNKNDPQWKTMQDWETIYRPSPYPSKKWDTDVGPIKACGMVRTNQYLEKTPTPSLPNKTSNQDCVNLAMIPVGLDSQPVISVNNAHWTTTEGEKMTVNVKKVDAANGVIAEGKFKGEVQSTGSYVLESGQKSTKPIAGVRWAIPSDNKGNLEMRPNPTKYPADASSDIFQAKDQNGDNLWWYRGKQPSPDTKGGKTFVYGEGSGPLGNTWKYMLYTLVQNGQQYTKNAPDKTATKVIELTKTTSKPVAVCTPNLVKIGVGKNLVGSLDASESNSPEGVSLTAVWQRGTEDPIEKPLNSVPSSYTWDRTGKYSLKLYVYDSSMNKSDPVVCNVEVVESGNPIRVEFWSLENRVANKRYNVVVTNHSQDIQRDVAYTEFTYNYVEGFPGQNAQANNPQAANAVMEPAIVDCRTTTKGAGREACNTREATLNNATNSDGVQYVGPMTVRPNVTNETLNATCDTGNGSETLSYNSKNLGKSLNMCSKSAFYFRTDKYVGRVTTDSGPKYCTFQSVSPQVTSMDDYLKIFPKIPNDAQRFKNYAGTETTVKQELQRLLNCGG